MHTLTVSQIMHIVGLEGLRRFRGLGLKGRPGIGWNSQVFFITEWDVAFALKAIECEQPFNLNPKP